VDEPLANRVRSGRKQPQRARHGSPCQPPTQISSQNRIRGLQIALACAPMLTCHMHAPPRCSASTIFAARLRFLLRNFCALPCQWPSVRALT
jgi:hypothetical protein